jgi:hypothetical protein
VGNNLAYLDVELTTLVRSSIVQSPNVCLNIMLLLAFLNSSLGKVNTIDKLLSLKLTLVEKHYKTFLLNYHLWGMYYKTFYGSNCCRIIIS